MPCFGRFHSGSQGPGSFWRECLVGEAGIVLGSTRELTVSGILIVPQLPRPYLLDIPLLHGALEVKAPLTLGALGDTYTE